MGQELTCTVRIGRKRSEGRAYLESQELIFRGDVTLRIPFNAVRQLEAKRGVLTLEYPEGRAAFELGAHAEPWMLKIRYPKNRLDKLGIKPTSLISVIEVTDESFVPEVEARGARLVKGKTSHDADVIVLGAKSTNDLAKLRALRRSMKPAAAVWVTWPKGNRALRENDVRRVAKEVGLVDVKVMSFSETLSGLKLVIPLKDR